MQLSNELLLASAARLYSLGLDLEGARETLRDYVSRGVSYSSPDMQSAYQNYILLREQFDELEKEHLSLRDGERL